MLVFVFFLYFFLTTYQHNLHINLLCIMLYFGILYYLSEFFLTTDQCFLVIVYCKFLLFEIIYNLF